MGRTIQQNLQSSPVTVPVFRLAPQRNTAGWQWISWYFRQWCSAPQCEDRTFLIMRAGLLVSNESQENAAVCNIYQVGTYYIGNGAVKPMELLGVLGKIVVWLGGFFAILVVVGFIYQLALEKLGAGVPPGELIKVFDRKMHLLCMGKETHPTVILEAGGGNSSITSRHIQTEISEFAQVCVYDRAGFGYSDPVGGARTFDEISQDLDQLLEQADLKPPYILVGESMGGLMVRNYYRRHPEKVAGIVLLDAAEEAHTFSRLDKLKQMQTTASATSWIARIGLVRLALTLVPERAGIPANLSTERRAEIIQEYSRAGFFRSAARELEAYFSTPIEQQRAGGFGSLGATPLVVVTHGKPLIGSQAFLEEGWHEAQRRLTELSSDSSLVVAEKSGHAISLDQPELVVKLVRELIEKIHF